jgi:hypothetical protein
LHDGTFKAMSIKFLREEVMTIGQAEEEQEMALR